MMVRQSLVVALVLLSATAQAQSLFDVRTYQPLASDLRAHQVGDSLTILIFESATATSRANTSAERSSSLDVRATDLDDPWGGTYSSTNEFEGGGVERRSGEIVARVSVTVQEVLANGELVIVGEQRIALNNEAQRIRIAGRLRPQDILSDNTALSSRLAEAQIEFKGRGMLSSREKPGLLIRFFQWLL